MGEENESRLTVEEPVVVRGDRWAMIRRYIAVGCVLPALGACAPPLLEAGLSEVTDRAAAALPATIKWSKRSILEQEAAKRIPELLASPLTEDVAIEIAVLSNPKLRVRLQALRATHSDYLDQANPPNPLLSAIVFDLKGSDSVNLSYGLSYGIFDLLYLPRRRRAAAAEFDAAKEDTVRAFIDLAAATRIAFYDAVASRQILDLMQRAQDASAASAEVAEAMHEAGNLADISRDREKLLAAETELLVMQAEQAHRRARVRLSAVLGLEQGRASALRIEGRLRAPPDKIVLHADPVGAAVRASLLLTASDHALRAAGIRLGMEEVMSVIGDAGVEFERERDDGAWSTGIGGHLSVPLLNSGADRRNAAEARLRMMMERRHADRIRVQAKALEITDELRTAHSAARFRRQRILPLAGKILRGAQLDYNAMQTGVFAVLDAKRDQLLAGRAYITSLRDYWSTRARYDQLMAGGGSSPTGTADARMSPHAEPRERH